MACRVALEFFPLGDARSEEGSPVGVVPPSTSASRMAFASFRIRFDSSPSLHSVANLLALGIVAISGRSDDMAELQAMSAELYTTS